MLAKGIPTKHADTIAELINRNNRLTQKYTAHKVMNSRAVYFTLRFREVVLGCIALERVGYSLTEVKHLSVDSRFKRVGIGKRLVRLAEKRVITPFMYATVRNDNEPSYKLFLGLGYRLGGTGDRTKILVKSTNETCKRTSSS